MVVEDVASTVDFYRDLLGFELVVDPADQGSPCWALLRRGEVEVLFQARAGLPGALGPDAHRPPIGSLTYYIDAEDAAALYERIRASVQVVQDLHATPRGTREFSILDPNGFILTFAEADRN